MKHDHTSAQGYRLWLTMLWVVVACCSHLPLTAQTAYDFSAQTAFDFFTKNPKFSASNYTVYSDSLRHIFRPVTSRQTPPPAGKQPFYLSHYGRHGSRYISQRKGYDIPYHILAHADSIDNLTPAGLDALKEMRRLLDDAEGRWGDLTGIGKSQHREIARRMVRRFPQVFEGDAYVDAHSTIIPRCVLSMGSAVQELTRQNARLRIRMDASQSNMWYMNHQDKVLRGRMMNAEAQRAYDEFSEHFYRNPRLMELLFKDTARISRNDEKWLNYYLLKAGLMQQNTRKGSLSPLIHLYTPEDIYHFWQKENAWWYITYGPSPLSGGDQPYSQRYLLRQIIQDADSCLRLKGHGATLRFGHETIVLPLVCLLGINGFDYQTADLSHLEHHGWWASLVFPMASNLQLVFYRSSPYDQDVLVKLLLNEQETTLPIATDTPPYYHWRDFRSFYLQKLDAYDRQRAASSAKPQAGN